MASNNHRRQLTTTSKLRKPIQQTDPNQLAEALASRLTIHSKGKQPSSNTVPDVLSVEDVRIKAMRSVNTALQSLSDIVRSGWKKSSLDGSVSWKNTNASARALATGAAGNLDVLRGMSTNDFDVERAALSVLGKLVALDMYDAALEALKTMHPRLCFAFGVTPVAETHSSPVHIISIPLPSIKVTDVHQSTSTSTYLAHAITTLAYSHSSSQFVQDLSAALGDKNTSSFLSWLSHFSMLPEKHLDSLLTRTYTALTKVCATHSAPVPSKSAKIPTSKPLKGNEKPAATPNPTSLFTIRLYALRCLTYTSPGVVDPNTLWDQATRFTTAYLKSCTSPEMEENATATILSAFEDLVSVGESRQDCATFLDGKGFVTFCDFWTTFAKRSGDICALDKIGMLMQKISSSSTPVSRASEPSQETEHINHKAEDVVVEGTKLCTFLAQTTVVLDRINGEESPAEGPGDATARIRSSIQLIDSSSFLPFLLAAETQPTEVSNSNAEDRLRVARKLDRAFERLRGASTKMLDSSRKLPVRVQDLVRGLLVACVDVLQRSLVHMSTNAVSDTLTRIFDSLFVLARTALDVQDPKTYIPAFEHLERAVSILSSLADEPLNRPRSGEPVAVDFANYYRCTSGAFYNIAGSLYSVSRYGAAVPFLKEACALGVQALGKRQRVQVQPSDRGKGKETEREEEWLQLEEQLYRRWELLAVCYLKNGDRKNSYNAFMQCVHAFPFASSGIAGQTDCQCPVDILGPTASSSVKHLAGIIDRVSYIGACELLLPPEEVSLRRHSAPSKSAIDLRVTGALLERQYESLLPSRWKEGTRPVLVRLLKDLIEVYNASTGTPGNLMPVRRARVLLHCMEFLYRDHDEGGISQMSLGSVQVIGQQALELLEMKDLGQDSCLATYKAQYKASVHLWLALHAHRKADPNQISSIAQHVNDANLVVKELLAGTVSGSPKAGKVSNSPKVSKKFPSPRTARVASPRTTRTSCQRVPAAPRKAPTTSRKTKAATNPSALVTPKVTSGAALQPVSLNTARTPPRLSRDITSSGTRLIFDNFDGFLELLHLTARILSLLSLPLPRVQVLVLTKRLSQRQCGTASEGFVTASIDLADEYLKLGKMKRATSTFNVALEVVRNGEPSPEVCARYLLRFGELLALMKDVPRSSSIYLEALEFSQRIRSEDKGMSSLQRIQARSKRLELAAMASHVFALVQYAKGDVTTSLDGMLQSLRLWNRALDAISRLNRPPAKPTANKTSNSNPFEVSDLKEALPPLTSGSRPTTDLLEEQKSSPNRSSMGGLEWRISEGLFITLFDLSQMYLTRGSAKEAEYFLRQVQDLATSLNLPAVASRALARKAEIKLNLGQLAEAQVNLSQATEDLQVTGVEAVDHQHLFARYNEKMSLFEDAKQISFKTLQMLEELDKDFNKFENLALGYRKSLDSSTGGSTDVVVPELLGKVLCRCIWLLRDNVDENFNVLLEKLVSLPPSSRTKAEENTLMANLTLHNVYNRFKSDMFLSSLTESTIAIPMGMSSKSTIPLALPIHDVLNALESAEKLLQANFTLTAKAGNVIQARDAAVSLALVKAFQTSLGKLGDRSSAYASSLLDASSAITLRREMLEAIQQKLSTLRHPDDVEWPMISSDSTAMPRPTKPALTRFNLNSNLSDCDDTDMEEVDDEKRIQDYWTSVQARYQSQLLDATSLSSPQTKALPSNWTVIHINVTEDKSTLLLSRQECGEDAIEPLLFCVPLKGRRDSGTGEGEEHLGFDDALREFADIVRLSDEGTKMAIHIKSDDDEARSNWWKQRNELDVRMKELLENIEFCWLGAFKTILSPRPNVTPEMLSDLRVQFDKVFRRSLHVKDKKTRTKHKKNVSQSQAPNQVSLDDAMLRCFSTLSPKCQDEELEDLLYFILDLYQFHGVPVAIAEVDALQVVLDLRTVLEEHNAKLLKQQNFKMVDGRLKVPHDQDEHVFLILDKNVQGIPWESIPILRGRSVSRIPSIDFLQDRVELAKLKAQSLQCDGPMQNSYQMGGAPVNPKNGYFILNPSGDLGRTEGRFHDWAEGMKKSGWDGIIGQPISEQQFSNALKTRDLVVYFGHGGGEQYIRPHRIKSLPTCAATMLWGCSSGALRDMGDFDRTGTPYNYMLAGCPMLVANLWDVTDRDIDKFSMSVFDKLGMTGGLEPKKLTTVRRPTSAIAAVAQSRDSCKLKYLTGAAPVVYGIPFYL